MKELPRYLVSKTGLFIKASSVTIVLLYTITFSIAPNTNGEDIAFENLWGSESDPISRLPWIYERSQQQIMAWNARLGEQLSIFWLNMPPYLFTLIATVTFAMLTYIAARIAAMGRINIKVGDTWPLLTILVFLLWPSMDVFFWKTTEAGYLQPLLVYGTLVALYLKDFYSPTKRKLRWGLAIAPLGFVAGLSFENTPVVLGAVLLILSFRRDIAGFIKQQIAPLVALLLGWLVLLQAKSTQFRIAYFKSHLHIPDLSWDYLVNVRILDVSLKLLGSSWILIALFAVASVYLIAIRVNQRFVVATNVAIFVNFLSLLPAPYTEPRSFLFAWLLMICAVAMALIELRKQSLRKAISCVAALLAIATCVYVLPAYQDFGDAMVRRDIAIQNLRSSKQCITGIIISRIATSIQPRFLNNREDWIFSSLDQVSKHYGCRIVANNE
jgi:hypothetical protein